MLFVNTVCKGASVILCVSVCECVCMCVVSHFHVAVRFSVSQTPLHFLSSHPPPSLLPFTCLAFIPAECFYIHSSSPPSIGAHNVKQRPLPSLPHSHTHQLPQSHRDELPLLMGQGWGAAEPQKARAAAGVCSEAVVHACMAARGARGAFVWAVTKLTGQLCTATAPERQLHLFIYSSPLGTHSARSRSDAHQSGVTVSAWQAGWITGWIAGMHAHTYTHSCVSITSVDITWTSITWRLTLTRTLTLNLNLNSKELPFLC